MARAALITDVMTPLGDVTVGLVALQLAAASGHPDAKLVVWENDEGLGVDIEYGIIDGQPQRVLGSRKWWDRQGSLGERKALDVWLKSHRWQIASGLLGGRSATQGEMDLLTDFVQWLGTSVGGSFMSQVSTEINKALNAPRIAA